MKKIKTCKGNIYKINNKKYCVGEKKSKRKLKGSNSKKIKKH
jgi:hypothetical protein